LGKLHFGFLKTQLLSPFWKIPSSTLSKTQLLSLFWESSIFGSFENSASITVLGKAPFPALSKTHPLSLFQYARTSVRWKSTSLPVFQVSADRSPKLSPFISVSSAPGHRSPRKLTPNQCLRTQPIDPPKHSSLFTLYSFSLNVYQCFSGGGREERQRGSVTEFDETGGNQE
jgi:hypothetical protein